MNILFITAHGYLPQMRGGMQSSTHSLISALRAKGHQASLLCSLMPHGWLGKLGRLKIKLSQNKKYARDMGQGHPVYRAWFPWEVVGPLIDDIKPDVIVVLARMPVRMALAAQKFKVPVVMMLQDVEFDAHGGDFNELCDKITYVANSQFTANRYRDAYGVEPLVVHPLIYPEKYRVESTGKYVSYINPYPQKGLDVALKIAEACPDIPFLFQEAWPLSGEVLTDVEQRMARFPNIEFHRVRPDMRQVYQETRILLAPSKWEEAFGRVAGEAQISGIPVVASNIGGLPEAVGEGGFLLDPNGDVADWIKAVRDLWDNPTLYKEKSDAALRHASRPEITVPKQIDHWISILENVVSGKGQQKET